MPRQTTLHKYTVPTEGDSDYESTFDKFFTNLDEDIEIRDTEANKSNYTPKDGAKYVATDSGAVYQGNGSSWILVDREFKSVSTEQGTITEDFDPVFADSLHAVYLAESLDGFFTSTSGSATADIGAGKYRCITGGTASSTAEILKSGQSTITADSDIKAHIRLEEVDYTETARVGIGRVNESLGEAHIAFVFQGGDIQAEVSDGSAVSTATVVSAASVSIEDLYIEFISGNEARFWADKDPHDNSPDATISSNLPSGIFGVTGRVWGMYAENPDGVDYEFGVSRVEVYNAP